MMLSTSTYPRLIPWTRWRDEGRPPAMIVPHVEAGHPGPIPLDQIDEAMAVQFDSETEHNSLEGVSGILRRARRNMRPPPSIAVQSPQ